MSGTFTDSQLRAILKSTEELVTKARLSQIAKEHQSIGSTLDDRCLYAIEEPKKRDRSQSKLEIEKRLHSRRGGRGELDIKAMADLALESFKDKGVNVEMLIGNYSIEQQIWKEKSSQMAYSQKRKYQYPELQQFKDSMSNIQRNLFKEKISEAIIGLADKYRAECKLLKADMDLNGIFHPEANAHRVHCIYLMKLYKGIRSDSIEDPILRRFMTERREEARGKKEDEDRKEKLMHLIESSAAAGAGGALKKHDLINMERELALSALPTTPKHSERPSSQPINNATITTTVKTNPKHSVTSKTRKLEPIQNFSRSASNLSERNMSSVPQPLLGGKVVRTALKEIDDESRASSLLDKSGGQTSKGPSDKLFKRMKRERLGASDSRVMLVDEASRLDRGEVVATKRTKDKNTVLDSEMSSWMLASLQKSQITKTSGGSASIVGGSLSQGHIKAASASMSPAVLEFAKSVANNSNTGGAGSPQKMMPFQDFYKMFQEYSDNKTQSDAAIMLTLDEEEGKTGAVVDSSKAQTPVEDGKRKSGGTLLVPEKRGLSVGVGVTTAESTTGSQQTEAVNIVKQLTDIDPNFDAYLRVAGRDDAHLLRTKMSSSSLVKPRRIRKVAPLGKEALHLKDSRGRVSKDSLKGFSNHFKITESPQSRGGHDRHQEEDEDDHLLQADDLIGRLRTLHIPDDDDDDDSSTDPMSGVESPSQQSPSSAAINGARSRMVRSRSRNRTTFQSPSANKKQSILAKDDGGSWNWDDSSNEVVYEMQDKLLAIWDCLQIPTLTRISFMRKYSSEAYSVEMGRAVDMWGEATVFVLFLLELAKCIKKVKSGLFIMPFELSKLLVAVKARIPMLLFSSSQLLVPASTIDIHNLSTGTVPLSAVAARRSRALLEDSFAHHCDGGVVTFDATQATEVLTTAMSAVSSELTTSYKKVLTDLDDVLFFGTKPLRDWLNQQNTLFALSTKHVIKK